MSVASSADGFESNALAPVAKPESIEDLNMLTTLGHQAEWGGAWGSCSLAGSVFGPLLFDLGGE